MNKFLLIPILFIVQITFAQQSYYNDVDLTLTGQDLYFELQNKIDINNTTFTYGDIRDVVKITDEDPLTNSNVLLIYGYDDSDGNCTTDRSRDKDDFGGGNCEYNREHTFPRSLANPPMPNNGNNTVGIGADPQNLRPSDVQANGNRGNKKFITGSGNAGSVSSSWYPGDEWKGDVARIMMYMYTRYGDRCLPSLVGNGATQGSTDMLELFLQWNVDDPVSELEDQRNPYLEDEYGNRNPFIDNPVLATIIWGGPQAEDRWGLLSFQDFSANALNLYPNPASEKIWVQSTTAFQAKSYVLFDLTGRKVLEQTATQENFINVSAFKSGMYLLQVTSSEKRITKKIIVE
ncbi:endonuclease [Marixanthomonas ophiurae]|uniref:T9SS C-terminal target domain-containing protein n=1 Tax=Marixanthomonas ophiurae TaxID=387659 RepID=A0A3E1Q6T8_9FLAO|nr:endonuclease [Marixanthomonas ophiurae]RFN57848.1 T9SS C-terminal target domain-containing protein [Marixanthomonas ophiurae]